LILERAVTPRSPSKPNKPLNIMVGTLLGLALGTLTFLPVFLVGLYRSMKTERAQSATGTSSSRLTGQKPDRFWRWVVVTVLALIAIPIVIAILGLLAAIAIPNFIKARQNAQQLGAQQLTQQGWQLWQDQKYPGALADFQKAVDLNPNQTNAWNGLGWAQFNSGEPHGAEQSFQKVIALDPKHPGALNGLGQIYLSQRKYYDAERYLLQAAPQAPAAWFGLARLYLLQGKFDQAETWAQKVVDSGQGDEIASFDRDVVTEQRSRRKD
jgi:tetratricopeptide (TPR) repeat protein